MAGAAAMLVGGLALLGWLLNIASLTGVLPGLATMKPNTAIGFVLAGLSIQLQTIASGRGRAAAQGCSALVALVGLATLSQDVFGWNAGIDELVLRDVLAATGVDHPGRMSPATALGFLMLGLSLALDQARAWKLRPSQPLAAATILLGLTATLGYLYGLGDLYQVRAYSSMALHTALLFVLLGVAELHAHPHEGWVAAFTNDYIGAVMARRVFPAGAALIFFLGWLRTRGEHAGWYGVDFGRSMLTTGFVSLFAIMIWINARFLNRTDAAQRRRTQELQASEARLRKSLREVEDLKAALDEHAIVATTDQKGKITYVNDKFCDISQYSREELLGQDHRLVNSGYHPKEFIRELWTTIAAGRVWKGEIRNRAKDGSIYWVDTTIVPFLDEDGKPRQYVAIRADVTARKLAEEGLIRRTKELSRSNAALEEFAYLASHDLQEPLRGVAGCVELLRKRYSGRIDARADEFIGHAVDNLERMRNLIQDLLEYSRLNRRNRLQLLDCGELLTEVCAALRTAIQESGARVVFEDLPQLVGDPLQLRQLFQNLVANAIKFRGPEAPRVLVSAERLDRAGSAEGGAGWRFAVRDNGIGIEPSHFERVFQIFKRLNPRAEYSGTGIGLAACKKIVERHGGKIWVDSEPDEGSTFFFTIADKQEYEAEWDPD